MAQPRLPSDPAIRSSDPATRRGGAATRPAVGGQPGDADPDGAAAAESQPVGQPAERGGSPADDPQAGADDIALWFG